MINHIDGITSNNHPDNLELVTFSENNIHRYRVLKHPGVKSNAKVNEGIVEAIRSDKMLGLTHRQLVQKYKVCKSTISYIVNKKTWKSS